MRRQVQQVESGSQHHAARRGEVFAGRRNVLRQNIIKLCPALQAEVKGSDDYTVKSTKYDVIWLLTALKLIAAGIDRSESPFQAIVTSLTHFHTLHQQSHESIEAYRRRFESA